MQLPLTPTEIILAILIITIGAIIQGSIGFGLGPFGVPMLLLIDPVFVPGPVLFSAFFLNLLMLRRERHFAKLGEIKWALFGRIIGTIIAAFVLKIIAKDILSLFFAVMVLIACGISISGFKVSINRLNLWIVGTLSGFMGTTSSIGGPPMALLYQDKGGPKLRGALSGIFLVGTIISMIFLGIIGYFGVKEIQVAILLLPGIVIGFLLSGKTIQFLDKGFIRPLVLTVSVLTSVILILRYIF
jgi:uncharacterized membrane protein YfcA